METTKPTSLVGVAGTPGQGPHMIIILKAEDEVIRSAQFHTYGCPAAIACGQFVCDEVEGMKADQAAGIDEKYILAGVGQMPLGREHCPKLATTALQNALENLGISPEKVG